MLRQSVQVPPYAGRANSTRHAPETSRGIFFGFFYETRVLLGEKVFVAGDEAVAVIESAARRRARLIDDGFGFAEFSDYNWPRSVCCVLGEMVKTRSR